MPEGKKSLAIGLTFQDQSALDESEVAGAIDKVLEILKSKLDIELEAKNNMSALTKSEMADKLFEELGFNKREAKELVEQFFEEIRIWFENNEQVKLSGFG